MARRRYDKARADRVLKHLREGVPLRVAAGNEGLDVLDVWEWAERRPAFATALQAARSHVALATALDVAEAAKEDDRLAERFLIRLGQESALDRLRALTCG